MLLSPGPKSSMPPPGPDTPRHLALLVAAALGASGCRKAAPPAFERPPAPVHVAEALARDVPVYLDEVGRSVAPLVVEVRPRVSGEIVAVHFQDGADLAAGDPLFSIDPRPFEAALLSARAQLARARAERELARLEFKRLEGLVETQAIAEQDYDTRKSEAEVAEAEVEAAEAALRNAELDLEFCSIRSPFDGRAGERLVDPGNVVTASLGIPTAQGGPLVVIQSLDPIFADFTIAEKNLDRVRGHMARGSLRVEVRVPEEPGAPVHAGRLEGELTFLDNAVLEGTGTVKLRATVPNPERLLWPGRFLHVRLVLETLPGAVLVPAQAPQMSGQGQFLYVVGADGTAELRLVTTGQRHGELVVVERGLAEGERVIVDGQLGVTPGGKVRIVEPAAPAAAAAGGAGEAKAGS